MKTTDFFKTDSKKINESISKTFGKKLNLEAFDLDQLQDARNKLRTQLSQTRSSSGFNENLNSDAYHQAQWMLDAINAEIAEREEFIVDPDVEELEEKAVSKAQQRFMGMVHAAQKGEKPASKEVADVAKDMGKKDAKDFASTKHKGLPEKVKKDESVEQGEDMTTLREGEVQQASAIVTAKTMVDRVGRWIEELSGMENETLLQLGDSIRDEMGQEQAKAFIEACAPAIQQALENLKGTRDTLSNSVRSLASGEQPADMLGAEPAADMEEPAEPDMMNAEPEADMGDEFAAAEPAAGGDEEAGRAQRESIERTNRLLKVLAG